jgi:4-amino-4-deoxy-L-arabinose transferase-like glycosyltransferase
VRPRPDLAGLRAGLRDPLGAGGRAGFALLLAVALVVVLHDLGGRSLHRMDSPRWGELAREVLRTGEWIVPVHDGGLYANKPPLYLWAIAAPAAATGEVTPVLVRLPSALAFVALVAAAAA